MRCSPCNFDLGCCQKGKWLKQKGLPNHREPLSFCAYGTLTATTVIRGAVAFTAAMESTWLLSSQTAPSGPGVRTGKAASATGPTSIRPPLPKNRLWGPTGPLLSREQRTRWLSSRAALNLRPHLYLQYLAGVWRHLPRHCSQCRPSCCDGPQATDPPLGRSP